MTSSSTCRLVTLVSYLAYSLFLKTEALCRSEILGCLRNTPRYNTEDCSLQVQRRLFSELTALVGRSDLGTMFSVTVRC
jgi:hypothetical protein